MKKIYKTFFLLIAYGLLLINFSFSQEIEWQNSIGGGGNDGLRSIEQCSDGGFILGGHSQSPASGDKTENSNTWDYWIVKTDSLGAVQWDNTITGNSTEYFSSCQPTADGGYIVGGYSYSDSSGDKTENNLYSSYDYWIVKTDSLGVIQWDNTIAGDDTDHLNSIEQTADGGYIIGGSSYSDSTGDKSENNLGAGADFWIVKTDASGNIQWENTIGGQTDDELLSVHQTTDGGYILGGWSDSDSSGDKTENSWGVTYDYWIVKTDSSGNIQWQNTIGGSDHDKLYFIQQVSDGGYIFGGESKSNISGDKTENCIGGNDYWVVKTDSLGTIQWQNTLGGSLDDIFLYSVKQTADGGYIIGGFSESNMSSDKTENSCSQFRMDYWVLKLDPSGNIQWQNTIGGDQHDQLYSVCQTNDGKYVLGGASSSGISGDKTENTNGNQDYWIVKITDKYNSITGKLFIDGNSNLIHDAGEPVVTNKKVTESNTGRFSFSDQDGSYSTSVLDPGNFIVSPSALNYYNPVPATHNAYFSGIQQTDSINDFAYQPGIFNDLQVSISPLSPFRPGFTSEYAISYENVGTTILNPAIILFPGNDISYMSADITPTSVTADSVVWNFGPLAPFQPGNIIVTVYVDIAVAIGTLINSSVRIEPVTGDADTLSNYANWTDVVTGSYDPNAIQVDRDKIYTNQLSNPPYLDYIIYFQNTGNDTAFNVKILNPIDTLQLRLNTLEFVSSSHPVNLSWIPWERNMEFKFDNILLPDSNINEPGSHGFVRYRIKPVSTLVAGDSVKSNAAIYFDFNQPVLTNTAVTEVVLPTGNNQWTMDSGQWTIYPNPATNTLTVKISSPSTISCQLSIYDLFGREVLRQEVRSQESVTKDSFGEVSIDVSGFSKGIYFIEIISGEKSYRAKFVKQ